MIFDIERTSEHCLYRTTQPIKSCKKVKHNKEDNCKWHWTIEIKDLKGLLDLAKDNEVIIIEDNGKYTLEIYDDYRE